MIQEKSLEGIEPIIPPEPVAFWPPQPGWYALGILLLIALAYLVYLYFMYKKRNAYRLKALELLEEIRSGEALDRLARLNRLLKATALIGFPRREVADLTGDKWIEFLAASGGDSGFSEPPYRSLGYSYYSSSSQDALSENEWLILMDLSARWIKKHKFSQTSHLNP